MVFDRYTQLGRILEQSLGILQSLFKIGGRLCKSRISIHVRMGHYLFGSLSYTQHIQGASIIKALNSV
jgi:hypothetical protein